MVPRSLTALVLLAAQGLASSPAPVCHEDTPQNIVQNPGFENGLDSWQANAGYVQTGEQSDGTSGSYFVMPGSQTIRTNVQTLNVNAGQTYSISADIQEYLDPSASVSFKSCIIGIVRVDSTGSSTLVSVQRTITKSATGWESINAQFTPQVGTVSIELAASCAGSTTSALQLRWDNIKMIGPPQEVCTTPEATPAPTSAAMSTPITTPSTSAISTSAPVLTPITTPSTSAISEPTPVLTPTTTPSVSFISTPTTMSTATRTPSTPTVSSSSTFLASTPTTPGSTATKTPGITTPLSTPTSSSSSLNPVSTPTPAASTPATNSLVSTPTGTPTKGFTTSTISASLSTPTSHSGTSTAPSPTGTTTGTAASTTARPTKNRCRPPVRSTQVVN